jgi:hypothetical protein
VTTIRDADRDMRARTVQLECDHEVTFRNCATPRHGDLILCYHCDRYVPVVGCHAEQPGNRDPYGLVMTNRVGARRHRTGGCVWSRAIELRPATADEMAWIPECHRCQGKA